MQRIVYTPETIQEIQQIILDNVTTGVGVKLIGLLRTGQAAEVTESDDQPQPDKPIQEKPKAPKP